MIALGYPTMADAGDAVAALLPHSPTAAEGLDRRIVEVVRRTRGEAAVPPLPKGDGWMFVELAGDDPAELRRRADAVVADAAALDARVVTDPVQALALWRIREDGAGLAGVSLARPAYGGWEDAAVPPSQLGAYLRDFDALLREHRLDGLPYGHFGDGCVHVRIDFPLTDPVDPRRTDPSWRPRPRWWPAMAVRCRASTATAGPGRVCFQRCTPPPR